jgi:pseudouridine kinase
MPRPAARPDILCIGAVLWDLIGRADTPMSPGDDRPGRIRRLPGGVAMNVGMVLARVGLSPALLGAVGDDPQGRELTVAAAALGLFTDTLTVMPGLPTDRYMAIEDERGLVAALADAHTLEAAGGAILAPLADGRLPRPWTGPVVLDGNLTVALLGDLAASPLLAQADLRLVPASPGKAERLLPLMRAPRATLYVNRAEAGLMLGTPCTTAAEAAEALIRAGAARALVTDGPLGAAEARMGLPTLSHPAPPVAIARVTGAGDTFLAAHVAAELAGADRTAALTAAIAAAAAHVAGKDTA